MSKDIETIEEVLLQYGKAIAKLIDDDNKNPRDRFALQEEMTHAKQQALQQIEKIIERDVIGKDDFSTYEHDELRNVVGRLRNTHRNEQRQALTNALYGKGVE